MWYNACMNRKKTDRDWYRLVTRGMGSLVCAASLALFIYLIRILAVHGPELALAGFFLVPVLTFAVGVLLIKLSNLETIEPSEKEANPMVRKIGILSDTHGLLRPEAVRILGSCDAAIHAGDIGREEILREIEAIVPLYAVQGNNDRGDWAKELDERICLELGGIRFFVVHDKRFVPKNLENTEIVVFGHSHQYFCETKDGILWLNPGSCGKRRFSMPVTMAVLELGDTGMEVIKYTIP